MPLLLWSDRRGQVTRLLFVLIILHSIVLIYGGTYTYARAPLGFWMQECFGFARNNYDRIGHFMQGFVPALIAREVLVRSAPGRPPLSRFSAHLRKPRRQRELRTCRMVGSSRAGQRRRRFPRTQGDPWDTQSDMFMALIGAACSLALLAKPHDRALARLNRPRRQFRQPPSSSGKSGFSSPACQ